MPLQVHDLRGLPEATRAERARRVMMDQACTPFDLERAPVWRAGLLTLADDDHLLVLTLHHIIADGWSIPILLDELARLYSSLLRRLPPALEPLPVQYAEHAARQRARLAGPVLDQLLGHWRTRLTGAPPELTPPADRPRPPIASFGGDTVAFEIPAADVARLNSAARQFRATSYMVLLAAFAALLHHECGGPTDVVVGTAMANREGSEAQRLVGFLANTLALRMDLSGDPTFAELVARARRTTLDALDHQELPFERLVAELRPPRSRGRSPVFQVLITMADLPERYDQPGLRVRALSPVTTKTAKFDLSLLVYRRPERIDCTVEYATDLFDRSTVERLVARLLALLAAALDDPGTPLSRLAGDGLARSAAQGGRE
jgi:non-ribosomal peptide synthetase component F